MNKSSAILSYIITLLLLNLKILSQENLAFNYLYLSDNKQIIYGTLNIDNSSTKDTTQLINDTLFVYKGRSIYLKSDLNATFRRGNKRLDKKVIKIIQKCKIHVPIGKPIYCSVIIDKNGKITESFLAGYRLDNLLVDEYFTIEIGKIKGWIPAQYKGADIDYLYTFPIFMHSENISSIYN